MKQITIISGKGGTGKTSITAAIATIAKNKVIADCDVDAPDLHLILNPRVKKTMIFHGLKLAKRDKEKCIGCMKCYESCKFDAISDDLEINKDRCEGCGVCQYVCPTDAISMIDRDTGYVYIADTRFGPFSYGVLIIIDGPPGIGCPVIASLSGVNTALIVVEPTKSGIHDMERILKVAEHFRVDPLVCINKYDLSIENSIEIEEYCRKNNLEIVGKIPFDERFVNALINGKSIIEYDKECEASRRLVDMWNRIERRLVR